MSIINLTPTQLRQAAGLKEKIEQLQNKLNQLQGTNVAPVSTPVAKPYKKKISAAGIARIRAAQKARWAVIKGAAKPVAASKPVAKSVPAAKPVKQGRRKMSAEARARIAVAAKARWAKVRAEKAAKR